MVSLFHSIQHSPRQNCCPKHLVGGDSSWPKAKKDLQFISGLVTLEILHIAETVGACPKQTEQREEGQGDKVQEDSERADMCKKETHSFFMSLKKRNNILIAVWVFLGDLPVLWHRKRKKISAHSLVKVFLFPKGDS